MNGTLTQFYRPAFHGHSKSSKATGIDQIPMTFYWWSISFICNHFDSVSSSTGCSRLV